jgi:hypothetical protein
LSSVRDLRLHRLEESMVRQSRPTFQKRLKEKARMEKQREKQQRKFEAKDRKAATAEERTSLDVDPDLAGIKLGPQAPPEEWAAFIPTEEEEEEETESV